MIRFGENLIFRSGEHRLAVQPWQRRMHIRRFAGLDGAVVLDAGRQERVIVQSGQLLARTAAQLVSLIDTISQHHDGQARSLYDHEGRAYPNAIIRSFQTAPSVLKGSVVRCDYKIEYLQLRPA